VTDSELVSWGIYGALGVGSAVGFLFYRHLRGEELNLLKTAGLEATATITEIGQESEGEWIATYRFLPKGSATEIQLSDFCGQSSAAPYKVGDKVRIFYDPKSPNVARIA